MAGNAMLVKRYLGVVLIAILGAFLISALLNASRAVTQSLAVTVSSSALTPPPQAVAGGFNINALNADFTGAANSQNSVDYNGTNVAGYQWYIQGSQISVHNCTGNVATGGGDQATGGGLKWPDVDPVTGTQDLRLRMNSSCVQYTNHGVGIVTESAAGNRTDFPFQVALECRVRMSVATSLTQELEMRANSGQIAGGWWNCWSWPSANNIASTANDLYEIDYYETHSAQGCDNCNGQFPGGGLRWGGPNGCGPCGPGSQTANTAIGVLLGNPSSYPNSLASPSDYHSYMMVILVDGTGTLQTNLCSGKVPNTCVQMDSYVDNVWFTSTQFDVTSTSIQTRQVMMIDATAGCGGGFPAEGDTGCHNKPLSNPHNDGSGNLALQFPGPNCNGTECLGPGTQLWYLQGVGGNVPDGSYNVSINAPGPFPPTCAPDPATCVFTLTTENGTPIPYMPGNYTGSGMGNPIVGVDSRVAYARVWVRCAAWQTTEC